MLTELAVVPNEDRDSGEMGTVSVYFELIKYSLSCEQEVDGIWKPCKSTRPLSIWSFCFSAFVRHFTWLRGFQIYKSYREIFH